MIQVYRSVSLSLETGVCHRSGKEEMIGLSTSPTPSPYLRLKCFWIPYQLPSMCTEWTTSLFFMHASPVKHSVFVETESKLTYTSYSLSVLNTQVPMTFQSSLNFFETSESPSSYVLLKHIFSIFRCVKLMFLTSAACSG